MTGPIPLHWWGFIVGILGVVSAFITAWRKGKVDESALVLDKWKELYDAHEARVQSLTSEISELRVGLREAERRILHLEQIVVEKDQTILERERTISGLERQLAQVTQSTPAMLGNFASHDVQEAADRTRREREKKPRS